ncbi:M3 family peptidase [Corallococcus coralloides DSM 2259]|uniref:M3 family peptidase n=1 Tax=Corallococcus coralloides (strain ATCC 25202 / DSM 2259 / NBRC 100086 / M2) TaxID=1144275 RepID=H8MRG0_CORCM|nr:M3 family metallopeptidase [Corallococcus coralloides]AFE09989.1 M3 family peptidase [Corallococcus coralloides DSM 2259]
MSEPLVPDAARHVTCPPEEFRRASEEALAKARDGIARLKTLPASTPPKEVLELFDESSAALDDAAARASVVRHTHPEAALREAAEASEQAIENLANDIRMDRGVYDVLARVDLSQQDAATRKWMEKVLRDFRRAGVDRDDATRAKVKALQEELVRIGQEFSRNISQDTRKVSLPPSALDGLPEDYVRAHAPGEDGQVRISTDYPDLVPFLTYARDGKAREELWRANRQRGYPANVNVLQSLVQKRHELATLLGYPHWAAYATEDKMVRTADAAGTFIRKIADASEERMKRDYAVLLERKRKDDPNADKVNPWDSGYLDDRVKAEQYAFDSQTVRPYFEYTRVKQGVLDLTARLFGVTYRPVKDVPVWHPDVEAYDVYEGTTLKGRFFLDMHPRADKYKHAAQFTLTSGKSGRRLPEGALICNFPKPGTEPALMQHGDVETFFHEFGHLLHHIFGGHTKWAGLSGVRTEWDFVEAPSQMLEEWARDVTCLQTFAKHYQTGEALPAELVERMLAADEFGKGLFVRQQMFYAALSLELYRRDPTNLDATALVRELQGQYIPFPYLEGTYFHLTFGHLDGYSSNYYTYMWSLVIAKDLFTVFQTKGLLNPEPAQAYRRAVLEPGGSDDAARLVNHFLGRDYDFRAYEAWLNKAA